MKAQILAAAILLGSSSVAMAADPGLPMEQPPVGFTWTGGYLGAQAGYAWGSADYIFNDSNSSSYNYDHDPDGFLGGIYAGYNHQFTNGVVIGGEADIAWGNMRDSTLAPGNDDFRAITKIDWTGSVRARLGYAMDRFLPYLTGGVAFGRLSFDEFESGAPWGDENVNLVGWTLGAGADYAVTDNWIVRGEYRYVNFNDKNFVTSSLEQDNFKVDSDSHDIRFGIAYKF